MANQLFPCLLTALLSFATTSLGGEISFVLDPLDSLYEHWTTAALSEQGFLNQTIVRIDDENMTERPLFGSGALKLEYQVVASRDWGGFVMRKTQGLHYNCRHADYLSVWYKNLVPQSNPGRVHFRLVIGDTGPESGCDKSNCDAAEDHEIYYSFHSILDQKNDDWQELRIRLFGSPDASNHFQLTGWDGRANNEILDPGNIRSLRFELSIDGQGGRNSSSTGTILFDHLSCVGSDGALFGAALSSSVSAVEGTDVALRRISDSSVQIEYMESGAQVGDTLFVAKVLAPGGSYYNLSGAEAIAFDYSLSDNAELDFSLFQNDGKPCHENQCTTEVIALEYTSNSNVTANKVWLDLAESTTASNTTWTPSNASQPLYIDAENLLGFQFEARLKRKSANVSDVNLTNIFVVNLLQAVLSSTSRPVSEMGNALCQGGQPHLELFAIIEDEPNITADYFQGAKCCDLCEDDPACIHAYSDGNYCAMANELRADMFSLANPSVLQGHGSTFVPDTRRANYCNICLCDENLKTIDCRDRNLTIAPLHFSETWEPLVIDFRDNSVLFLLPTNSFRYFGRSLTEVFLPHEMVYIAPEAVMGFPSLNRVQIGEVESLENQLMNAALYAGDSFSQVCCSRGEHVELVFPPEGIYFCDIDYRTIGVDSEYEPFVRYEHSGIFKRIERQDDFMADGATSPAKCAEYCSLHAECRYFTFDRRRDPEFHSCELHSEQGGRKYYDDQLSGSDFQHAAFVSGIPPRTRHISGGAEVKFDPLSLETGSPEGYETQYTVMLGANPKRGAVWITPTVVDAPTGIDIEFAPSKITLYDNETSVVVDVFLKNKSTLAIGGTVRVLNSIHSCDTAFTAASQESLVESSSIIIDIIPIPVVTELSTGVRFVGGVFIVLQGLSCLCFAYWTYRNRNRSAVQMSQPFFLYFVLVGCFMIGISAFPLLLRASLPEEMANKYVPCMLFPWIVNLGFITCFSALFAKIWRVYRIVKNASVMRRATVRVKDVIFMMVLFMSVSVVILTAWQVLDPLRWTETGVSVNDKGYPTKMVRQCSGDWSHVFWSLFAAYDSICLAYALYLCYITRDFPSELGESKWITASIITILQLLLLGVPVLVIASDDEQAFFFVRACLVFLISTGVSCFMFLPKICRLNGWYNGSGRILRNAGAASDNQILSIEQSTSITEKPKEERTAGKKGSFMESLSSSAFLKRSTPINGSVKTRSSR